MDFLALMKEKAKANKKVIVLPESYEKRNLEAAAECLKDGLAEIVLIGNKDKIMEAAGSFDVSDAIFVDPESYDRMDEMVAGLAEARKSKGMTLEEAKKLLMDDSMFVGVMLVKMGVADGMVSGAIHSTADTLRPALQILKTAPGTELVSSFFIMVTQTPEYGDDGILLFADCALNQNPTPAELACIAGDSAKSYAAFVGKEARVAMLSHSTMGSAKHADVTKVVEAVKIAKEKYPEIKLDGEIQLDAAIVKEVGELKAPTSPVAGKANCLVFPDIDAGNIGYKLVQRFGKAEAFGPVLQGIAKPVNDLSRGCSANDIVAVVAMTAVQAEVMGK
ncbi:phosphate acetyltransferase [Anaerotignum sp.]|uniref:phosphate acetyltransferase n=1 Tax=Anaerotignum sp. TaxID=2039241 RepID=UPI0033213EF3